MSRTSPKTETLLPCPFCGGKMEEVTDEDGHYWVHPGRKGIERADCWLCDAWISDEPEGEGSIGEWNTRTPGLAQTPDLWRPALSAARVEINRQLERCRSDRDAKYYEDLLAQIDVAFTQGPDTSTDRPERS